MKKAEKIKHLHEFLVTSKIPEVKEKPKTFLGIAKQPHYENVLSNLYAFYFDIKEEHGMYDLFISTFLEIIDIKGGGLDKILNFNEDFEVTTELATKEGRIDIFLESDYSAIIIENKVNHQLINDLDDYWKHSGKSSRNKIGIVLSLKEISKINHVDFINITHLEFLTKVMENSGKYLSNANDKYMIFLKDFYQNILNLSDSIMDNGKLSFYLEHQNKINDIQNINGEVHNYILSEIDAASKYFETQTFLDAKSSKRLRYYRSNAVRNLMFTIVIDKLLDRNRELWIGVELQGDLLKDKERYRSLFKGKDYKCLLDKFYAPSKYPWDHFAGASFKLEDENYNNLQQFVIDKIEQEGFLEIFNILNSFLKEEKNKVLEAEFKKL